MKLCTYQYTEKEPERDRQTCREGGKGTGRQMERPGNAYKLALNLKLNCGPSVNKKQTEICFLTNISSLLLFHDLVPI